MDELDDDELVADSLEPDDSFELDESFEPDESLEDDSELPEEDFDEPDDDRLSVL